MTVSTHLKHLGRSFLACVLIFSFLHVQAGLKSKSFIHFGNAGPPTAADDMIGGVTPGTTASVNILANDLLGDGVSQATPNLTSVTLAGSQGVPTTLAVSGQGTWTYDPTTGILTFTPIPGYTTSPTPITYTLTETSSTLSATATVTVNYVSQPPAPQNDIVGPLTPGATAVFNILNNDKLSDGSPATPGLTTVDIDQSTSGTQTSLVLTGKGTWTYDGASGNLTFVPVAGFTVSPPVLTYTLFETLTGLNTNAQVTVSYTPAPPQPVNDSQSGFAAGATATLNILGNDKISDGSAATPANSTLDIDVNTTGIQNTLVTAQGTWTYSPGTGSLNFVPLAGFTASPAPLTYSLTENLTTLKATATVTFTYTASPPQPANDAAGGFLPGSVGSFNILANDNLSDGSPATPALTSVDIDQATAGTQTTLTVPGQGVWAYNNASGGITFTPNAGFTISPAPITYSLIETATGSSATATVTFTYVQKPPQPVDDIRLNLIPGASPTIDILANDKLSDNSLATPALTSADIDQSQPGTQTTLTVAGEGIWTYDPATGRLSFTPQAGSPLSPTPLTYTLFETSTGLSANALVTLKYKKTPPEPADDALSGLNPGQTATLNILANDKLSDGSPATPASTSVDIDQGAAGIQTSFVVASKGTWTYDPATGNLSFVPVSGFTVSPSPLTYTLIETATALNATALVTLTYTKKPPQPADDAAGGFSPGTSATVNILGNDKLSDGSPALATNSQVDINLAAPGVQTTLVVAGEGTWTYSASTGILDFVPVTGFTVSPTPLTYSLTEIQTGLSTNATATLTYIKKPPVAANDALAGLNPGATATLNILANDKLSDGSPASPGLTEVDLDQGQPGVQTTFAISGEGTWTYASATGSLSFVPFAGFTVNPSPLTYTLLENSTGLGANAVVTLTYVKKPPLAVNDAAGGFQPGTNASVNILANDKLSDGSAATTGLTTVDLDLATAGIQTTFIVTGEGTWTYNAGTGALVFSPFAGFSLSPAPITYALTEKSTSLSASATVAFTYIKKPPLPANDALTGLNPGSTATVNILANDKLSDGSPATAVLTSVDIDQVTAGTQTTLPVAGEGTWTYNAQTGTINFNPQAGFALSPTPLTYTLTELSTGLSANAVVTLTYTKKPPLPVNDVLAGILPGNTASLNILTNDKLSDGSPAGPASTSIDIDQSKPGTQITFLSPGQGTWTYTATTGILTFVPVAGFVTSPAPLTYTLIETATGLSANAVVTVSYSKKPPIPANDSLKGLAPGAVASLNILANDKLSDGTAATPALATVDIDATTAGTQKTYVVTGEGTWNYTPGNGTLTFSPVAGFTVSPTPLTYLLTENATQASASAVVTLSYAQAPPFAANYSLSGFLPGTPAKLPSLLVNDKLSDGNPASPGLTKIDIDIATPGIQTSLAVSGQGTWTYDPVAGILTFVPIAGYTVSPTPLSYALIENSTALSATGLVTFIYTKVPPIAVNDIQTGLSPGSPASLNILFNDKLSDGSPATAALTTVDLDQITAGTQTVLVVQKQGTWTYDATTGKVSFAPVPGYTISPSPVTYTLIETATALSASATITAAYVPAPPQPANDLAAGNVPTKPASVNILLNDKLSDGSQATPALTAVDLDQVTAGVQTTLTVSGQGTWNYDPLTGILTFTPVAGFILSPGALTYTLTETVTGLSANAVVTVSYVALPPVANNDTGTGLATGVPIVVNVLGNDRLSNGSPALPNFVTVDLDQNTAGVQTTYTVATQGTWTYDPLTGNVSFVPLQGYVLNPGAITYTLTEISTGMSATATISLTSFPVLQVGLAKSASQPQAEVNGSYTFTYLFTVKNFGNIALTNFFVKDDLSTVFPSVATVTIKNLSATGTLLANTAYDGKGATSLLLPASTLAPGSSATISLTLNVFTSGQAGSYLNSASAQASAPAGGSTSTTTDVSTDGLDPDPNGNGNPSDPGENIPTTVTLNSTIVKIPEGFSPNSDGINDRFVVENTGSATLDLTVFNRWGNVVYKNGAYHNDWDGTSNSGLHIGQNLPDGTYYYILLINGAKTKVKFLTIHR